jgi:hypothetical protein
MHFYEFRSTVLAVALMAITTPLLAQNDLPSIDLATLATTNAQQAGGISSIDGSTIKPKAGTGVLVYSGGTPLTMTTQAGDFAMRFDVLLTNGTDAMLTLPSGDKVDLNQSRDVAPLLKSPGLWQTIYLAYRAGTAKAAPMVDRLIINNITIKEGQILAGKATGKPVQLMAQSGSVAIRNVGVRALANRNVASWTGPLTYKLYKVSTETREGIAGLTPVKTDTVGRISYNVAYGQSGPFAMLFDGKLNVPAAGDYQFDLHMGGISGLWIDGRSVIAMKRHDLGDPETRRVPLTAGTHDVEVLFARSWPRPGLGLFISQPDTRPQALHADGSLPEFAPVGQVLITADAKPTLIRSFLQMPGEVTKRTHSLSVGSRTGMHYSVDLNQMALLMAWKGDFIDATDMWYERGEPQLIHPRGTTIYPAPRTALAVLPSLTTAWPDSVGDNVLQYKGISLDKDGSPSIDYAMNSTTIRDQIRPTNTAFSRTLTLSGTAPTGQLYCRLAAGKTLEEVAKGLYAVDDRSYFVRFDPKAPVSVRQSGGKQELIMPVSMNGGKATVQYSLEF